MLRSEDSRRLVLKNHIKTVEIKWKNIWIRLNWICSPSRIVTASGRDHNDNVDAFSYALLYFSRCCLTPSTTSLLQDAKEQLYLYPTQFVQLGDGTQDGIEKMKRWVFIIDQRLIFFTNLNWFCFLLLGRSPLLPPCANTTTYRRRTASYDQTGTFFPPWN